MKIQQILIRQIKKSKFFKRKHSKQQLKSCCLSLNKHGQYQPIIVSQGQILCGNLIYDAAKELKWKKILVYDLGKLSEQKKKQIRYLDNHTFQLSTWKEQSLKQLLMMIDVKQIQNFGFTEQQAYNLVNDLQIQQEIKIKDIQKQLGIEDVYICKQCGWQGTLKEL